MIEAAVFLMQVASALVVIAGGAIVFTHLLVRDGAVALDYANANDFEIDYRRVLSFARLAVHR